MQNKFLENILKQYITNSKEVLFTATAHRAQSDKSDGEWVVNIHEMLDFIIEKAGRYCDAHSCDILRLMQSLQYALENDDIESRYFVFGIRRYGVDGIAFVVDNLQFYPQYFTCGYYRGIYAIELIPCENKYTKEPELRIELKDISNVSKQALNML